MLSTASRGGLPPEEVLKRGSSCAVYKVSDAEGAPEAGGGQSRWRDPIHASLRGTGGQGGA